ncbi:HD domain-containing protein [Thermomonospora catenispora]|uniref:HD domain-containing protein n=1 Tax=Thermomonospora catenispora TaxID=2493090 RepID=UPI0011213C92|nr:HD domain-containing protein [Thermomonospora catenispora]TNY38424.1 HD domain-containing protein [Thermomonospora catenispora]
MDLLRRWIALAGEDARDIGAHLIACYRRPHRRHHTAAHLTAVLDLIDELAGYADDPDLVRLAAWFHDAVYDPRRGDNEERSAVKAERMLAGIGLPPRAVAEVARLVRLTVAHDPGPDDRNGRVLCDADLAVVGADPKTYAAYAAAVREEYAFVPEERFRAGRAEVLRSLLDRPELFHTPVARARFEAPARRNLRAELALLQAGGR